MKTRKINRNRFSVRLAARIKLAKNMVGLTPSNRVYTDGNLTKIVYSLSDRRSILLWSQCKNAEIRENDIEETIKKSKRRSKTNVCGISSASGFVCGWIQVRITSATDSATTTISNDVAGSKYGKWLG